MAEGPRRFYKQATIGPDFEILLDGKPLRTPSKAALRLPNEVLAKAVAAEWQNQGGRIDPRSMALTKLANTATDRVPLEGDKIRAEILSHAAHDLVCYRAGQPVELKAHQSALWDGVLHWANTQFETQFMVTEGLAYVEQPQQALNKVNDELAGFNDFQLVALHELTALSGSALIALMVAANALKAEDAWAAATADDTWSASSWGRDEEAEARLKAREADFHNASDFLKAAASP